MPDRTPAEKLTAATDKLDALLAEVGRLNPQHVARNHAIRRGHHTVVIVRRAIAEFKGRESA